MTKYIMLLVAMFFILPTSAQSRKERVVAVVTKAEKFRKKDRNYQKAIDVLQVALREFIKEGNYEEVTLAPLYHKLSVNYYKIGDFIKAEHAVSKALDSRLKIYGDIHIDVARGYFSRASILRKSYRNERAKEDLDRAIYGMEKLIYTESSYDTIRLIRMYDEYIRLNIEMKNNFLALEYWEKSYRYYAKKEKKVFNIASLFTQKGQILTNQKKYHLANDFFQKAVNIYNKLYAEDERYKGNLAGSYLDLALVQTKLNLSSEALKNNLTSIKLFKEIAAETDSPKMQQSLGNLYANLVALLNSTNAFDEAEKYFEKSFRHNLVGWGTIYHTRFAELYQSSAQVNIKQQKYTEALQSNQKALQSLLPTLKTANPLQLINLNQHPIKDKISFLETLKQKAEIFTLIHNKENPKDLKYLQAAFQNYQTLDTVITQIRQSYAQGSKFELIEQSYPIYEKAIAAGIQLFEKTGKKEYLEAAYYFTAKNKALVLLSGIQEQDAKSLSAIPANLLTDEKALKQSIYQLESKLYEQAVADNKVQLQDSLFTLRREHQKLIHQFEEEYPDYFTTKYGFDKRIEISALQEKLVENTALIEYFVGDEQLFIFTITKTSFDYVIMKKPTDFKQNTLSFRKKMESQAVFDDKLASQSHQLYQWLLVDALEKANKSKNITHLIIIPDGILMQLPFDVFLQEETGRNYVLRDYAVSYAYSNQLLFAKAKHKNAKRIFAGFGLAYDDYTLENLEAYVNNPLANVPLSRALGKLQYSADEIIEISDLLNGNKWLNEAATREAFLENAGEYAILHLATHGIVNEEYPMNSALIFTRQNDSTEYFLRAADLYNMDLNADMAVLSACNTGAGTLQRGEGVRSLARAFSYAGCPSLIASLWSAADKSTKDILVNFYKNLKTGMTKDEAMRQAKLTYLDNAPPAYQSPYYWSHLSVIGDSSELEVLKSTSSWKKYAIGGLMGLLIIGIWGYRRRKMTA